MGRRAAPGIFGADPMTVRPRRAVAMFDSASTMLRAIASGLRGEPFPHVGQRATKAMLVRMSAVIPSAQRSRAYALAGGAEGLPPRRLASVDMSEVARWIVDHYPGRDYPGVLLGASNGAATHLCVATGMPWLPQTVLIPVRRHSNDPDDSPAALRFGQAVAPPFLRRNPDIVLHHMHDGNQDRLMAGEIAYFRTKWASLPEAYTTFLASGLRPGAPIVVLDDESRWPTTRVGERHVFQTGARGGLAAEEYLHGTVKVAGFLREQGSSHTDFSAPDTDGQNAEAEWGFEGALLDHIMAWAESAEHPVIRIRISAPQALSGPIADLMQERVRLAGGDGNRLLIESFAILDPARVERAGVVPYWSFFPVEPSLVDAAAYVRGKHLGGDRYHDVDLILFSHGTPSLGATPPQRWTAELAPYIAGTIRTIAGTRARWPGHFDTLGRYGAALAELPNAEPALERMPVREALASLARLGTAVEDLG